MSPSPVLTSNLFISFFGLAPKVKRSALGTSPLPATPFPSPRRASGLFARWRGGRWAWVGFWLVIDCRLKIIAGCAVHGTERTAGSLQGPAGCSPAPRARTRTQIFTPLWRPERRIGIVCQTAIEENRRILVVGWHGIRPSIWLV